MTECDVAIVGGGASGLFAAIACAEAGTDRLKAGLQATGTGARVRVFERGPELLAKVRISGGGRCNVTQGCYDPRELSRHYPRGGQALLGPFSRFQPRDTMAWFESRGVHLKREPDGRVFPQSDSSRTIIECLLSAARQAGVEMVIRQGVSRVSRIGSGFELLLANGQLLRSRLVMLATGGCRGEAAGGLPVGLGHTLEPPVPSLFGFEVREPWIRELAGVSLELAAVDVAGIETAESRSRARLSAQGPIVVTHTGLSGPAILKLSAWGAREFHDRNYHFQLRVNWLPRLSVEQIARELKSRIQAHPARRVTSSSLPPIPQRLWQALVLAAGIPAETRWSSLSKAAQHQLILQLTATELTVTGKNLNKDEFVTCGGVRLNEVDFKTMESRIVPGLYFGGEILDIDGLTGGYNFQAAWTTGWIAGQAMGQEI